MGVKCASSALPRVYPVRWWESNGAKVWKVLAFASREANREPAAPFAEERASGGPPEKS